MDHGTLRLWSDYFKKGDPEPTACWRWERGHHQLGYGVVSLGKGQTNLAHRLSWELTNGWTYDMVIHTCDTRDCYRPSHLVTGERRDVNMVRQFSRNRQKLSLVQVRAIKRGLREGRGPTSLGQEYGVNKSSIRKIRDGLSYRWVDE